MQQGGCHKGSWHGAHFRGARCGLNYISSSCFYKVSDSSPRSQCWSSDRAESDCRQAGRLIWPQNHKLSLTLNGPQQEGKSNQNMKSTPRAAVSSLWPFWFLSPFPALKHPSHPGPQNSTFPQNLSLGLHPQSKGHCLGHSILCHTRTAPWEVGRGEDRTIISSEKQREWSLLHPLDSQEKEKKAKYNCWHVPSYD